MKIYQIEIIEPKAQKLIQELVKLNLIKVKKVSQKNSGFQNTLDKLKSKDEINFDEITNEVELVRSKRYEKNKY